MFFTKTPFVQAWSIFFVASENKVLASSMFPAYIACSNFLTAVLYADLIILFLKVFFSITLTLFFADFIFGMFAPPLSHYYTITLTILTYISNFGKRFTENL